MRVPSSISIASRFGSSSISITREHRLALAVVFMQHSLGGRSLANFAGWISKNALHKATETVCMSNNGKRVAWVTGGGSGIGESGAEFLAADGWTVVDSGRRKDALDAVVAKITSSGGQAETVPLDANNAADRT